MLIERRKSMISKSQLDSPNHSSNEGCIRAAAI
jgi:hypothetical protein